MTRKLIIRSLIAVGVCLLFGFVGTVATQSSITGWYAELDKPWFDPPHWMFGPAWLAMYVLIGISAGVVWSKGFYHKWVKTALYHFIFQLLLNGFWFLLFFGLQQTFLALLVIIALLILILITIRWFKIVSQVAAYLLIPYAIWVLFALVLTFEIWKNN